MNVLNWLLYAAYLGAYWLLKLSTGLCCFVVFLLSGCLMLASAQAVRHGKNTVELFARQ